MSDLEKAVEFFQAFLEAEFQVRKANLEGSKSFAKLNKKLMSMVEDETVFEIRRKDVSDLQDEFKEANDNALKKLGVRCLYAVEQFVIGKRKFYAAYVGPTWSKGAPASMGDKFIADNSMKLIGTAFSCSECNSFGEIDGRPCPGCRGRGWTQKTGEKLKPDKRVDLVKLVRPSLEGDAKAYDAL